MDSEQVTVWLQTQHQDRVSKMDKFFTDAFAQAGCILITCSRAGQVDLVGHAVCRTASRDVADLVSRSRLRTAVLRGISRVRAIRAGLFRQGTLWLALRARRMCAPRSPIGFVSCGLAQPGRTPSSIDERYLLSVEPHQHSS
jgi:hypothetical protein